MVVTEKDLVKFMKKLMSEVNPKESKEYKEGYMDGVLDFRTNFLRQELTKLKVNKFKNPKG